MDDEVAGAVYGGLAYPVYEFGEDDLRIDLNDKGVDKDCVDFWPNYRALVFASLKNESPLSLKWYVETNFYGHYLVFDGDDQVLHQVLQRLAKSSIGIERHGESSRRANDGYHYDWFVRLASDDERDDVFDQLSNVLGGAAYCGDNTLAKGGGVHCIPLTEELRVEAITAGVNVYDSYEVTAWLAEQVISGREEKLQKQLKIYGLEAKTVELENKVSEHVSDFMSHKRQFTQQNEILKAENFTLKESVESLRKNNKSNTRKNNRADALEVENSNLKKKVECIEKELADYNEIYEEWERQNHQLERLEKENAELSRANQKLNEKQRTPRWLSQRVEDLIEERLNSFNHLLFPDGTAGELAEKFEELDGVYSVLKRLEQKENIPATSLNTVAPGWKEVKEHIHTGQNHSGSDMGRIYYRVDRADGNRLFVVVHHKQDDKEQQRFFERLAKR